MSPAMKEYRVVWKREWMSEPLVYNQDSLTEARKFVREAEDMDGDEAITVCRIESRDVSKWTVEKARKERG